MHGRSASSGANRSERGDFAQGLVTRLEPATADVVRREYRQSGFHVLRSGIEVSTAVELTQQVDDVVARGLGRYVHDPAFEAEYEQTTEHYVDPHLRPGAIARFVRDPGVVLLAETALQERVQLWRSVVVRSGPGSDRGQSWHQDLDPVRFAGVACNILWYPHGCGGEVPALFLVPGSQDLGRIPPGEAFGRFEGQRPIVVSPRDLILLDTGTFHMVPRNSSSRNRIALVCRFARLDVDLSRLTVAVYRNGIYDHVAR